MLTDQFLKALPILEKIEAHGHQAYFVGGCVRDLFLNRQIKDIDITTSATPHVIQQIFPNVIPVGIEHGTVIVRHEKESYEVTTFRTEGVYSDGRRPDHVEFIHRIDKDLERRDFTINALAMDKKGKVIDLFEGQHDLNSKLIRTVGEGQERFREDALRIIRALRFSSQLGFQIEESTLEAMIELKTAILDISTERITNEMERFFAGEYLTNGLDFFLKIKVSDVLPVFKERPDLIYKLPENMKPLYSFAEVITLFHFLEPGISITEWTKEWKCSNRTKRTAISLDHDLKRYRSHGIDEKLIYHLNRDRMEAFIRLVDILFNKHMNAAELLHLKDRLPIQSRSELAVNGNDLLAFFPERKSGAWVKITLEAIEEAVITGKVPNDNEEIREWLKWNRIETD